MTMRGYIDAPADPQAAIYTEDNLYPQHESIDSKEGRKETETPKSHAREHRALMIHHYRQSTVGTGLGFGNVIA